MSAAPMSAAHMPRREFLHTTAAAAAASLVMRSAHGESPGGSTIRLALVGCGGRGSGAVADAINAATQLGLPIKLVAMADVFEGRLSTSRTALEAKFEATPEVLDVPPERQFVGFDAYRNAIDALRPGDVVLLTTPLAFHALHFAYAVEKGVNVFMEKPVVADGPSARRMLDLSAQADAKNLKCAVGLMVRHCRARQELKKRLDDGAIGPIVALRAYRMHGPIASAFSLPKPPDKSETMWQIERFHSFLWASGGLFSDFYIHQIDETSWMKNAWPVKAHAVGGRHFRGDYVDQNFDSYAVEYTYPDGAKLFFNGRTMAGCKTSFTSIAHGGSGSAYISKSGHSPGRCQIFSGQSQTSADRVWKYQPREESPYVLEWKDLLTAITNNESYNEIPRGVAASMTTSMGRMAAHTGREVTYEQMLGCDHEFAPNIASLTPDGPAPLVADAEGRYPQPQPGIITEYEYLPQTPVGA